MRCGRIEVCVIKSSACERAVAGTHGPGRGEGVEGFQDISSLLVVVVVGVKVKDNGKYWKS